MSASITDSNVTITVQPNPSSEAWRVNVTNPVSEEVNMYLTDISGKHVWNTKATMSSGTIVIPNTTLRNGIYFLKIDINKKAFYYKLVKI